MSALLTKWTSYLRKFFDWCSEISSILIFLLVLLVTADVFGRYVLSKPIPGTYEFAELGMVFIVFLAYAYAEASGQNIRIQLIENKVTPRQKYLLDSLAYALGMLIFGVICWQAWGQAWIAVEAGQRASGLLRIPMWPAKFVLVFGSFLLVVQFFTSFIANIPKIIHGGAD